MEEVQNLRFYIKNKDIGITKEMYFEICESMGSEPIDSQIPLELDDLTYQTQEVLTMFDFLPDSWNSFSGHYMGKELSNIQTIFEIFEVHKDDWLLYTNLLNVIIEEKMLSINDAIRKSASNGKENNHKRVSNPS